jgi:PAS domain S-box-containing protein
MIRTEDLRPVSPEAAPPRTRPISISPGDGHTGSAPETAERRLAEDALRDSQSQLLLALRAARMIAWNWDPATDVVTTAGDLPEIYGCDAVRLSGEGFAMIHPDDRERHCALVYAAVRHGKSYNSEFRIVRPDNGRVVWMEEHASAETAADGTATRLFGVVGDISARKMAEAERREAQDKMGLAAAAASIGVWDCDPVTGFVTWSPELERMFGLAPGTFEGAHADFVRRIHPDDRDLVEKVIGGAIASNTEYETEFRYLRPDGEVRWMLARGRPHTDSRGGLIRLIGISIDVTGLRRAHEQLQSQAEQLARSASDLENFAHIAAHDLKEPLRGIRLTVGMLQQDCAGRLGPEDLGRLERLDSLVQRMGELLDATLFYSKVGHEPMQLRRCELGVLAAEAVEGVRRMLDECGARVTIQPGLPALECNAALVRQVFANLIGNAVKYNESTPRTVEIGSSNGRTPVLFVRDNGIGIPREHHGAIFGMFKKLHSAGKYGPSTGAGLAIVKRVVERHGGRVWVESEPGLGSTFWLTLGPGRPGVRGGPSAA